MMAFPSLAHPPEAVIDLATPTAPGPLQDYPSWAQLDSESDDANCATPLVRNVPGWPGVDVLGPSLVKRRDCTVESRALAILARTGAPTKVDILGLVDLLPRNVFLRSSSGPYLVMGASPRSRDSLLNFSLDFPSATRVFNRFMRAVSPSSRFCTLTLRLGCVSAPLRDSRNGPCKAVVIAVSPQTHGDGLWVQDPIGLVPKSYQGKEVWGTVHPISEAFQFDSRKLLHAGHCAPAPPSSKGPRTILVGFCTLHVSSMPWLTKHRLLEMGFPLPNNREIQEATFGGSPLAPPRLRQLCIRDFMTLPPEVSVSQDVIEVIDSPNRGDTQLDDSLAF